MTKLENTFAKARILWHSLFYGMKAADAAIQSQVNGEESGTEINEKVKPTGVFADMLEQKVTKEVEELRDKNYRVLKEADKYTAEGMTLSEDVIINEKGEEETILTFKGGVTKKTKADFMKHPPVYETEDTQLILIQDVKQYEKNSMFVDERPKGLYDFDTNIEIKRSFIPRFEIEKFAKKIVIRKYGRQWRSFIDIYLPTEASQFGKIDAILISNLYTLFKNPETKMDIVEFDSIAFYTDHAWNSDDFCKYEYENPRLVAVNIFDGSFVLTFDAAVVAEGEDLSAKYKTKELDEKYEAKAVKDTGVNIFAAERRAKAEEKKEIDLENINNTTLKLGD